MKITNTFFLITTLISALYGGNWYAQQGDNLQPIIDQMLKGDRLTISSGEYPGSITINQPIEIIGIEYPIINGNNKGTVISIDANNVVLKNIEVQWSGTSLLDDEAGIKIVGDNVLVEKCRIINTLHGIYVKGGNNTTIRNNYIQGRVDRIEPLRGNGIHLWNTKNNLVENNEIEQTRDGIYFSFADDTRVLNNYIHHLRYGLHYMYSDNNFFQNNIFEHNVAGAALMYSKYINFSGNIFTRNRSYRSYAILYQSCDYSTATNNLIINNTLGVSFVASNYNEFSGNDIVSNDIAVQINASCEENKIYKNNFIDNLSELLMSSKGYTNYWANDGIGNYWSNYPGYDLDGDEIGDVPYRLQSVFEYLENDYPEVRLYLFSPAAQVLKAAEQVLPILRASGEKDLFPSMLAFDNQAVPWKTYEADRQNKSIPFTIFFGLLTISPIILIIRRQK